MSENWGKGHDSSDGPHFSITSVSTNPTQDRLAQDTLEGAAPHNPSDRLTEHRPVIVSQLARKEIQGAHGLAPTRA